MPKYDFPNKRDAPEDCSDIYTPSTAFVDERSDIYTPSSESLAIVNGGHATGNNRNGPTTSADTAGMHYSNGHHYPVAAPPRLAHAAVAAFPVSSSLLPPTLPNGQVINAKNTLHNNGGGSNNSNRNKGFHNDHLQHEQPIVEAQVLSSSFTGHGPYNPAAAADIAAAEPPLSNGGFYEHGDPEIPAATTITATATTADVAEEAFAPNKAVSESSNENANWNKKIKAAAGATGTTVLVIVIVIILKAVSQGASDSNNGAVPRPSPPLRNWSPSLLSGGSTRSPLPPHWSIYYLFQTSICFTCRG